MTFFNAGGTDAEPGWLAPLIIVVIMLSPVVVGLLLRLFDRRTESNSPAPGPASDPRERPAVGIRFVIAACATVVVAFGLAGAGQGTLAIALLIGGLLISLFRFGYPRPRW